MKDFYDAGQRGQVKSSQFYWIAHEDGPHLLCTVLAQPHPTARAADILVTHRLVGLLEKACTIMRC